MGQTDNANALVSSTCKISPHTVPIGSRFWRKIAQNRALYYDNCAIFPLFLRKLNNTYIWYRVLAKLEMLLAVPRNKKGTTA